MRNTRNVSWLFIAIFAIHIFFEPASAGADARANKAPDSSAPVIYGRLESIENKIKQQNFSAKSKMESLLGHGGSPAVRALLAQLYILYLQAITLREFENSLVASGLSFNALRGLDKNQKIILYWRITDLFCLPDQNNAPGGILKPRQTPAAAALMKELSQLCSSRMTATDCIGLINTLEKSVDSITQQSNDQAAKPFASTRAKLEELIALKKFNDAAGSLHTRDADTFATLADQLGEKNNVIKTHFLELSMDAIGRASALSSNKTNRAAAQRAAVKTALKLDKIRASLSDSEENKQLKQGIYLDLDKCTRIVGQRDFYAP